MNFLKLFLIILIPTINCKTTLVPSPSNLSECSINNVPIISECNKTKDLYANGNYLKSACLMNKSLNYDEALNNCHKYKMELYAITTEDEMMTLYKFSDDLFQNCNGCCMWVNGRKAADGKWYVYPSGTKLLYPGIEILDGDDFTDNYNEKSTDLCNRISNQGGPEKLYISRGIDCSKRMYSYCEYNRNST